MNYESEANINFNWFAWKGDQNIGRRTGRVENQSSNKDYPICNISKDG